MSLLQHQLYQEDLNYLMNFIKRPLKMKHILVTGATGLIGSLLVDAFLKFNENNADSFVVYCIGRQEEKMRTRFKAWEESSSIHFLEGDIRTFKFASYNFDYIIHAASNADPKSYARSPADTISTNVQGTYNILEYARLHPDVKVFYASTFEVYGKIKDKQTYSEEMYGEIDYNEIRSGYPESKRVCELLMRSYRQQYGLDFVIGRLCSVYGPTMIATDSKAHAQFIRNALNDEDIVLKSEGMQIRSYCYAADAAAGIIHLLFSDISGEVYNIANANSVSSILNLAKKIASIKKKEVVLRIPDQEERKGYSKPQDIILNAAKLEALGWTGQYTLDEGLQRTLRILEDMSYWRRRDVIN